LELIKKEANNLIKFKHSNILNAMEACIENKHTIAFVTEPIVSCLNKILIIDNKSNKIQKLLNER